MKAKKIKFTILPDFAERLVARYFTGRYRVIVRWGLFAMLMILLTCSVIPVHAGLANFFGYKGTDTSTVFGEVLSGTQARNTLNLCFGTDVIQNISGLSIVEGLTNLASIFGMGMVLLYAGVSIVDMTQHGELTKEHLLKIILTFAIPALFIVNYTWIHERIQELGTSIKDGIVEVVEEQPGVQQTAEITYNPISSWGYDPVTEEITWPITVINYYTDKDPYHDAKSAEVIETCVNNGAPLVETHVLNVLAHTLTGSNLNSTETRSYWEIYKDNIAKKGANAVNSWVNGDIWGGLVDTGETVLSFITGLFTSAGEKLRDLLNAAIATVLQLLIIIVDILIRIGILSAAFGVLGRLAIYQCFIPMGVADIGKEGTKGNGMRLIKTYLAVFLEIGMLFVFNYIGWQLFQLLVLQMDSVAGLVILFIGAGAGIRAMMKGAKTMATSILGVR